MRRLVLVSLLILLFSYLLAAQQTQAPPTSDQQAVTLVAQAMTALTGGTSITDATLNGTVSWVTGGDHFTGTATAYASGIALSRIDISTGQLQRSEIRNGSNPPPAGAWTDASGNQHAMATHNCWTEAPWFFPALLDALSGDPSIILTYVGQETKQGLTVNHIRAYRWATSPDPIANSTIGFLSLTDIYLNAVTALPVAITFSQHSDKDLDGLIATEVRFSAYQTVTGFTLPFHVQRFVNGSLNVDFSVSSVAFNTGIPSSEFALQ